MNPHLELPKLPYAESHPRLFELAEMFLLIQRRVPHLFESYIAPYDLSYLAWNALALIEPLGEHATLSAIGDNLRASPSTMTGIAARLAQAGLVERTTSPSDRRVSILRLTDRGKEITDTVLDQFFRDLARVADQLGGDVFDHVAELFQQILDVFDLMEHERGTPRERH